MAQHSGDVTPDFLENGRLYCGFRRGRYLLPIDEGEKERLDIFHKLILLARQEKLYDVDLLPGSFVLDLGTGTGIWAIDVADELFRLLPSNIKQVVGLDFALIQPRSIPSTIEFEKADVEAPWPPEATQQYYDLVHIQMMLGSIRDWPDLYRKSLRHLKPGGSIEHVEIEWIPRSDDNTLSSDSAMVYWSNMLRRAMQRYGQPIDIFDAGAELRAAGFTDITEKVVKLPVNPWSNDEAEITMGQWFNLGLTHGLEALSLAPFTRVEGWPKPEVDALLEAVKRDLNRLSIHAYCRLCVYTCRLPSP